MQNNLSFVKIGILLLLCFTDLSYAQIPDNNLGQVIHINTHFNYFAGRPSWTLIIRDIDHNQNMPYLFDITGGDHHYVVFTYGRNFLITVSRVQIVTYQPGCNTYKQYRMRDFCHLESHGRIIRGESMNITIEGDLTPDTNTFSCNISTYPDVNFSIYRTVI